MYQKRRTIENMLIWMIDIFCVLCSSALAFWIRFGRVYGIGTHGDQSWQIIFMCLLYMLVNIGVDFNHRFFRRGPFEELVNVVRMEAVFALIWVVLLYVMHRTDDLSRLVFGYFIVINTVLTYIARLGFKQYMIRIYKHSRYSSRLLLVTSSERVGDVIDNLVSYREWNRVLAGVALLDRDGRGETCKGYPVVASRENLMDYVIHYDIDEVFIAFAGQVEPALLKSWVAEMEQMGVIVDLNIETFDMLDHGNKSLNRVGKYAVVTFARNLLSTRGMIMKRMLDIAGGLAGMILLAAATVFVAPAIKLESPGPVFFAQTRIGKNGRRFTFYKFRSMYQDAEERKKKLMAQNEVHGLMFKMKDDPRITKVGRFIRKTSIDELPQFWNVLRGDMSLVGTRPPTVDEFEQYEAKHKCRLSMTPGLTGLWQISGRSDIKDFDQVVKLDMEYIDNWSILKDIKILLLTVGVIITGRGSR
ncbi:MAG: sugar transferase [Eubacteriales bacterium]|nr:sugar transferase [Eubacteriales bacterium]